MRTRKIEAPAPATPAPAKVARLVDAKIRKDLAAGTLSENREGKILSAIREGTSGVTARALEIATGLRAPTVRYYGTASKIVGGPVSCDSYLVGGTLYLVARADDKLASAKARENRATVLALVASGVAPATPAPATPAPAKSGRKNAKK